MNENINNNDQFWDIPESERGRNFVPVTDPGEKDAEDCKIFGILSLFVLPIVFCVLSLVKYKKYQEIGDGSHQSDAKVGRTCSLVSIGLQAGALVLSIILMISGLFFSFGVMKNTENAVNDFFSSGSYAEYYEPVDGI